MPVITTASLSAQEDVRLRTRRYLLTMAIRTACFLVAIVLNHWSRWLFVVGAAVLPYIAVVVANARNTRPPPRTPKVANHRRRQLTS